jgi:hypothetical protein
MHVRGSALMVVMSLGVLGSLLFSAPVTANALKVEIALQDRWSAGVQEIVIE